MTKKNRVHNRENQSVARATHLLFILQNSDSTFKVSKNLNVANDVQNFRMKYIILEATQKQQILTNVGGFKLYTVSDPWIYEFCTSQNTESFVLIFFTIVEYIIVYL
jgi:hypothetical protein